jgi:hypothetical protein
MIHDESNKLLVQIEEQYVHQIVQEHLRDIDMPQQFDDDENNEDIRDTIMVGRNADAKLFENDEEILNLKERIENGED